MSKYNKKPFDEEDLGTNIYLNNEFRVKVSVITESNSYIIVYGEPKERVIKMEKQRCGKVYQTTANRLLLSKLTPNGKSLMLWLLSEIDSGRDWLWINYERYMEENDIKSFGTYKRSVKELISKGILGLTLQSRYSYYWINPAIVFNGSRILKYPDRLEI